MKHCLVAQKNFEEKKARWRVQLNTPECVLCSCTIPEMLYFNLQICANYDISETDTTLRTPLYINETIVTVNGLKQYLYGVALSARGALSRSLARYNTQVLH